MGNTVRMEARRIFSLPPLRILVPLAVLAGTVAALFVIATESSGDLETGAATAALTGAGSASLLPFVGLPVMLIGVVSVLEETRYHLATVLLLVEPRRGRLALARLVVLAALSTAVGLTQTALAFGAALALGRPVPVGLIPSVLTHHLLALILLCWAGAALGWLTSTAAIPAGLLLLDSLLVEPLFALAAATYSPGAESLSGFLLFSAARDATSGDPGGLVVATAYTLALLTAAAARIGTRDY
ncbi:hypothetical protein [Kineosporia sp. NBRC 101731]|uniref:hypothetical protein n=1 Tax=Kineosporia sp. NBRC 101731 TaxID=3032199 RepID=UPI0024A22372|nr:hypothetical protein [Kineosporia sp. NBRC 101731]GLY31857.1 hypothetical protein Kisp02_52220 [Kineosporia sp. NBRC 101731]